MNKIKSILSAVVLTLGVFGIVSYSSCSKKENNPCDAVTCQNGGTCNDGKCQCPAGYEGASCETKTINKFVGSWNVTELLSLGGSNTTLDSTGYVITINVANSTTTTELLIDNIGNAGNVVRLNGTVSGNNITVEPATIGGKIYEVPTASLSGTTMNIRFTIRDAVTNDLEKDRTASLSK